MATVVRTDHLTKDFFVGFWRQRPHRALDAVSMDIASGEVFGLLGPNGAGKSTTLKLLLHLLWPSSGRIELLGRPAGDIATRRRVGFLPEQPTFYDHLTAEELLTYFAGLFGYAGGERRRRVGAMLDLVGLGDDRRRPLRQLSKGLVQRVGLAQALVNDPELVILDEPMSGLDPLGRRQIRDLILRLRDEGRTVLFSSHILSDAELLCSRVGILSRGHLVAAAGLAEFTASVGRGWEVVVADLSPDVADRLQGRVRRLARLADRRYSLELPPEIRPEPLVAELAAAGASLVSVMSLRATLEDVFLERLASDDTSPTAGPRSRDAPW
jgi:ABC-2 type transport system ATP-binding protein